jgi:hypothetical protein
MNPRGGGPSISHGPKVRVEFHVVAEINRERKSPEVHHRRDAPLAQLAEQLTLNQWVPGSSPGGCTTETPSSLATSLKAGFRFALKTHKGIFTGYLFSPFLDRRPVGWPLRALTGSDHPAHRKRPSRRSRLQRHHQQPHQIRRPLLQPAHVAGAHFSLATTLPGHPASAWQRSLHPG